MAKEKIPKVDSTLPPVPPVPPVAPAPPAPPAPPVDPPPEVNIAPPVDKVPTVRTGRKYKKTVDSFAINNAALTSCNAFTKKVTQDLAQGAKDRQLAMAKAIVAKAKG